MFAQPVKCCRGAKGVRAPLRPVAVQHSDDAPVVDALVHDLDGGVGDNQTASSDQPRERTSVDIEKTKSRQTRLDTPEPFW
jgi:hypothetical protein